MIRGFLILAAVLAASVASPATAQKIYNLPAGQYLITGDVRAVGPVISPDGPVVPTPDPVPDPTPVSDFSKAITAAIGKIPVSDKRHESAMKLMAVYKMLGDQIRDGKIHPVNAVQASEWICGPALGSEAAAWSGVFSVVNAEVGKAGTAEATAGVFDAAAVAVLSTVPASGPALALMQSGKMMGENEELAKLAKLYGFDWNQFLMMLLEMFLKMLPFIISAIEKAAIGILLC